MARHHFLHSPYGEVHLEGLSTHLRVEATSPLAADWALGWWHARQRPDEALFCRSFWRGNVAAKGRASSARAELDAFVRRWATDADLAAETAGLTGAHRARVEAYVQGFNQPSRFGSTPWTPEDCHLLVRTLGFLEWWETRAPQIEFLLGTLPSGLDWSQILDLWPHLGPEPDRSLWTDLDGRLGLSADARRLIGNLVRFRRGKDWIVPPSQSLAGRPLLAGSFVTDAPEPFLAVHIETPDGSVRGLSRPGHPGFLAGKTRWLAWQTTPVVDDIVALRIEDGPWGTTLGGRWVGAGRTGTLQALLTLEEATSIPLAEKTRGLGSACLDVAAVDFRGEVARWTLGARWKRSRPGDAWLPDRSPWPDTVEPRVPSLDPEVVGGRLTAAHLEALLSQTESPLVGQILPALRFLLPDTVDGNRLRRWTGHPESGPEARQFDRLYESVVEVFWEASPRAPHPRSAAYYALLPAVDRLVASPHSSWFPSREKNGRLAEAVRRAFSPGRTPGPSLLGRDAARARWTEDQDVGRTFATTAAFVADPGVAEWNVWSSDPPGPNPFETW